MSAVSRKTASSVSGQSRVVRTSEGIRTKQAARATLSSGQGASNGETINLVKSTNNVSSGKSATKVGRSKQKTDSLRAKEDEYRRMNAELEAKTSELVKEAEELLKGNLSILSDLDKSASFSEGLVPSPPISPSPPPGRGDYGSQVRGTTSTAQRKRTNEKPRASSGQAVRGKTVTSAQSTTTTSVAVKAKTEKKTVSQPTKFNGSSKMNKGTARHTCSSGESGGREEDVDLQFRIEVDQTVQRLEREMDDDVTITSPYHVHGAGAGAVSAGLGNYGDDILPSAAENMGSEATIRFLKAKLRVMQEEMDRLCQECSDKDKQLSVSASKLKELTEQNAKLQRSHKTVSSQVDKYKQTSDNLKHKCDSLEAQITSLRKEIDGMKTSQKKATGQQGALEVRLNRALEELGNYKSALQKARSDLKDASKQEQVKVEQLTAENKQLTRQRTELIAAFKKQLKLIDVLKRQKMHLEAAKMLSFTEEEFVKALDWGAS